MTIYLIRHGQTEANKLHLYCGSTDIPLSEEGREALKGLSYTVDDVHYITSGMRRTEETLQILFGDVQHKVDSRFREIDFGSFEMKSYEQLKDNPDYQIWLSGDNERNTPPGGESGESMKQRALEAFHCLKSDSVVITHGGVIAAIMASLYPQEQKSRYDWQPKPGHGYRITESGYTPIP